MISVGTTPDDGTVYDKDGYHKKETKVKFLKISI
jgi:hypothetical protein